jgi:pyruvate/2-oxoglutarate/acetoin dehydrogenase E1 component
MRMSIVEALREAIRGEMARDERVFCIGEDIGIPGGYGGAFTVTLGLEKQFPERIIDTPISEAAIFGMACGAALMGLRPIADVQYGDFLLCAADQIIDNIAKLRYMSGGKLELPLVMRAPVGVTGRGAQHAQSLESYFLSCPGIKIVAPATAYDAMGLLRSAVRDEDPVLIFEHKLLYGSKGMRAETGTLDASSEIPEGDFTVPIGRAAVRREGRDVTLVGHLLMMHHCLLAAENLQAEGVSCEVIDPRTLWPLDTATILASVRKTGRVVLVEESPKQGGVGAELAAQIAETIPDCLLAPVTRVAAPNTPSPFSPVLEKLYVPQPERIAEAARRLVREF